ncbi:rhamnogalacturonan lyase family protein [Melioribacter sp. OK-6-Me]|uniref:rhamnogalacturonan lyase family protein n=1 Tax=unclassified Melioribacter TaxID=2627329 RepID=UPI003ED9BD03
MKLVLRIIIIATMVLNYTSINLFGQSFRNENLGRGVIAVPAEDGGIFIGWRLLADDPDSIKFNIYRGNTKINDMPLSTTNFIDSAGTLNDNYKIVAVIDGNETSISEVVTPWENIYKTIPLQRPQGGRTPDGVDYTYSPNDASAADLDGDGQYEIVLKWDPSNSKDNSKSGYTGNVYLDGLELDGTLLWRIDLGRNIRAGAHYTQFIVYDLDGDGRAEVACKTADGTIDGQGNVIGDPNADYRNSSGYILAGPEYFTIFDGLTGKALATTDYLPPRGNVSLWGDSYGNRVDRFLACVAYLDGEHPSVVMCRGYYTRTVLAAWDWRNGQLTSRWVFDTDKGYPTYAGQGNHNLSVADLDGDGKDEIIYGSMAVDDDGTGLWNSGLGHGDALHVSDIDPNRPGLEVWGIHEKAQVGSALLEGRTGKIIWGTGPGDVGRGVAANLLDSYEGMECWGGTDGLRSVNNIKVGPNPPSSNFVVWWDGDLERELLDNIYIQKYGNTTQLLLKANGCASNNDTKATPSLQADLFGDWREEVIWRTSDNTALRIYTTNIPTSYRIVTLMQDRQYRLAIAWQNVGYNQPPHPSFFVGKSMFIPDSLKPPAKPINLRGTSLGDTILVEWDMNVETDVAGYLLYKGKSAEKFTDSIDVGNVTSYLDTNVKYDTTYFYALRAYDFHGNKSDLSDVISVTPTLRPEPPTAISYRHDNNSCLLMWEYSDINLISQINIYRSESKDLSSPVKFKAEKNVTSYEDKNLTKGKNYYYALTVTDTNNVESLRTGVIQITPADSFVYQSEDANLIGTVFVENNHLGYHGSAFTNFDASNSTVEFTSMPGYGGGPKTLLFRYALGNTDRTGSLIVNGKATNLTMRNTGDWTNYVIDSVEVNLNEGYNNTISFSATGSDFGNLDEIIIKSTFLTTVETISELPAKFVLYQNYPNPFNPSTIISYTIPVSNKADNSRIHVLLKVYDALGRQVATLVDEQKEPGIYTVEFKADDLPSGIYFYQLSAGNYISTKKMILLK